jgi:hypothetical protein
MIDDKSIAEGLAKNIGEQMSGKILCPRECVEGQMLSTYGDEEDCLFCPHCELDVEIVVKNYQ